MKECDIIDSYRYIEKEYKRWQEVYHIPFDLGFDIKLLLQLRYEILTTVAEHTKTKFDLIKMADTLRRSIDSRLCTKSMLYVNTVLTGGDDYDILNLFVRDKVYSFQFKDAKQMAQTIKEIAEKEEAIICLDITGADLILYDYLKEYGDLVIRKLKHVKG